MQVAKIERHKHVAGVIGAERGKWAEKWAAEEGADLKFRQKKFGHKIRNSTNARTCPSKKSKRQHPREQNILH